MKSSLFIAALLGLALATSCATGGNGSVPALAINATNGALPSVLYLSQSLSLTSTVNGTANSAVTWSLTGPGTLTPNGANATYVAPSTPATGIVITLALNSDTSDATKTDPPLSVVDVSTQVTPSSPNVGIGLTQQFTATATPNDLAQTFNWTCTPSAACTNFTQDPNTSGLAYYTANSNCTTSNCVVISAASTADPNYCAASAKNCSPAQATPVASRVSGTYAFRFSGYDNSGNPLAAVGTFKASTGGVIASGTEEVLNANGWSSKTISGGSYTPTTSTDPNDSNNAGTLTLNSGISPDEFQVVLDSNGDLAITEIDGNGHGSGVAQQSSATSAFQAATYAFGFTGVDTSGKRVGYVGVLSLNGAGGGSINGGQMDVNEGGSSANGVCASPPCTIAGSYTENSNGSWTLNLTSPKTMSFDFYEASGSTSKTAPLTLYAISTDTGANPAVSGTMVLQDSSITSYNTAAFNGISVSALTGLGTNAQGTNVSLTLGTTDGNGNFSGSFDQNNDGTVLSGAVFPPSGTNTYTYAASGALGRYTFNMLGNPTASPAVAPIPFILYASGANRGFLLDQSSAAVITGTMSPQGKGTGIFVGSTLPGTFAAATVNGGDSSAAPIAGNLLLTYGYSSGNPVYSIAGTLHPGGSATGTYDMTALVANTSGTGTGKIALTAPSTQNYVIYVVDSFGCGNSQVVCEALDFFMIDEDTSNTSPSVIFATQ
jgi:hypothetical protein